MGLVQNLQLLILKLVCLMGWLSSFVFAQFDISEGVLGSVNFPALGITCVANLAVFVTSLIRGRLDLEIGARDVLDIVVSRKLKKIDGIAHGVGLITSTQESQDVASKERVGIQKIKDFFQWLRHRLDVVPERVSVGIQKMKEVFQWFRHQLDIVLRVREEEEEEGLPTASIEEGDVEEVRLRTSSGEEIPVQSVAVVMLSNNTPNLSIKEFMKSNASIAGSILLQFFVLQRAIHNFGEEEVPISPCQCTLCNCVVFWSVEEITNMLAANGMVRTLKRFPNSLCLIPCRSCLTNDCHRRGEVQQLDEQRERETTVVSEILDDIGARSINAEEEHICICIPILQSDKPDVWTELLLRSLRSKDAEGRGVRVMASEALEGYLSGRTRGSSKILETVEYNIVSFIVPRLTEIVINLVLTFWFRVDGFSSSLVARRAVRDYLVDSKGSGFAATAFLTKAAVKSDFNNTKVCQVLTFRGDFLGIKTLSFIVGAVNLICSLGWAILIGFEADISPPLAQPRVAVIVAAVGFALCTDSVIVCIHHGIFKCCLLISFLCVSLWFSNFFFDVAIAILVIVWPLLSWKKKLFLSVMILEILSFVFPFFVFHFDNVLFQLAILVMLWPWISWKKKMFLSVMVLEIVCFVFGVGLAAPDLDSEYPIGRWVYGVFQILVWVKWAGGSYILTKKNSSEFFGINPHGWGILLYSSAFFLNAVLAGVRCKWDPWPWGYLFSEKHGLPPSPQASFQP